MADGTGSLVATPPCPHGLLHLVHAAVQLHPVEEDDGGLTLPELKVLLREGSDDKREEIRILETGHVKTSQCLNLPRLLHKSLQVFVVFVQFFF